MRVLFVMTTMIDGGAQKSLIALLKAFSKYYQEQLQIDLLVFCPEGIYMEQIPSSVNLIETPKEVLCMSYGVHSDMFKSNLTLLGLKGKITHIIKTATSISTELDDSQLRWKHWKKYISDCSSEYDVAVAYMQGIPNYYVIDKCKAKKKYLYIHHEYTKLTSNHSFDYDYFSRATGVITVSERSVKSIESVFPDLKNKLYCIENIISGTELKCSAESYFPVEYNSIGNKTKIILSIGRLNRVKRFDRAIDTARILNERSVDFKWFIIGQGDLKEELMNIIYEDNLHDKVMLLGFKPNPYPYLLNADVFVQTSDNEGKSVALDEAKLLGIPSVITNYATAKDAIIHGKEGFIAQMDSMSIADNIEKLLFDSTRYNSIKKNLRKYELGNENEVKKAYSLFIMDSDREV